MSYTNRGAYLQNQYAFRGVAVPANYYVALVTSATAPTVDTNTLSELTEIAAGNGYTAGGYQLTPGTTDFDSNTENDTLDRAETQIKDVVWTASGGSIPASGSGARYAVLTTNEGTVSARQILMFWSLGSDRTVSDGQPLSLINLEFRGTTV
jgi:hypothetical protein